MNTSKTGRGFAAIDHVTGEKAIRSLVAFTRVGAATGGKHIHTDGPDVAC